jgi:WD40 repeat protein
VVDGLQAGSVITAIWYEISIYLGMALLVISVVCIAVWKWKALLVLAAIAGCVAAACWLPAGLDEWRFSRIHGDGGWSIVCSPDMGANPLVELKFLKPNRTLLKEKERSLRNPSLSRDGLRIAFSIDDPSGAQYGGMGVANSDGTGIRRLLPAGRQAEGVAWSPDGKVTAFWSNRDAERQSMDLHLFDTVAMTEKVLLRRATFYGTPYTLSWSPDGRRIVFASLDGHVSIVDRITGKVTKVVQGDAPSWSPDGSTIVYREGVPYSKRPDEGIRYFAINPSGGDKRLLFEGGPTKGDDGQVTQPVVWSPDSRYILYLKVYDPVFDTNVSKIYTLNVVTGERLLIGKMKHVQACSWSGREGAARP